LPGPPANPGLHAGQLATCQPANAGSTLFIITLAGSLIFEQALLIIFDPLNEKRGNIETSDFNKYQSRNVKFRNPNVKIQPQVKFQMSQVEYSNIKFRDSGVISFLKNLNPHNIASREIPIEMAKKDFRSGKGAKAQVLTRFINNHYLEMI
jgi:hypothetical protein